LTGKFVKLSLKKYQLSEHTRSRFVPKKLGYMQAAERRFFFQYSLGFLGQIIYYSILQLVLLWLLNAFIFPDFFQSQASVLGVNKHFIIFVVFGFNVFTVIALLCIGNPLKLLKRGSFSEELSIAKKAL